MLKVTVQLLVSAAVSYAALVVLGWPLRVLIAGRVRSVHRSIPSALLGLAVLQVAGWMWLDFASGGIDRMLPLLLGAGVVACVAVAAVRWRAGDRPSLSVSEWTALVIPAVLGTAAFVLLYRNGLRLGYLTSTAVANNDLPVYASGAKFAAAYSYGDPAPGFMGLFASHTQTDGGTGIYVFLATIARLSGREVWQETMSGMLISFVLLAQTVTLFVRRMTRATVVISSAVGLLVVSTYLFATVAAQYFLTQTLAMSYTMPIALIGIAALAPVSRSSAVRLVCLNAVLCVSLLMFYPQMVFLLLPLLGLGLVLFLGRTDWWRRSLRLAGVYIGSLALACILIPTRLPFIWERLVHLNEGQDGGPSNGTLPWGLVGAQSWGEGCIRQPVCSDRVVTPVTVVGSVLLVIAVAALAVVAIRRHREMVRYAAGLVAVVLVSYAYFYFARGGPSYVQWKWITFLQPLFIASVVCIALVGARVVLAGAHRSRRLAEMAVGAVLVVLIASGIDSSRTVRDGLGAPAMTVTSDLATMADSPALADEPSVNLDLGPYWETMWGIYALQDRRLGLISESYWGPLPTLDGPTVRPASAASTVAGLRRSDLANRSYLAVPEGLVSGDPTLTATLSADLDMVDVGDGTLRTTGVVTATNTGTATWYLDPDDMSRVRLGRVTLDPAGSVVVRNDDRIEAHTSGRPDDLVFPGESASFDVDLISSANQGPPAFLPVIDGRTWFETSTPISPTE